MKMKNGLFGLLGILFLGLIIGCNKSSPDGMENELKDSGKVIFRITDAPFPSELVAEANITVDWVNLYAKSENEEELEDDEENTEDSDIYTIALAEDSTFNLIDLSNGLTAFLGEAEVPAGEYSEIRMHILDAEIVLLDGAVYDLKVPSGSSSGLKIKINPSLFVEEGEVLEVLLDFDVSRSFVAKGSYNSKTGKNNIIGFNFKPVIRAVPYINSGQIAGVVADTSGVVLENALIALIFESDTVTTALTTDEGYYAIVGIPEGNYSVNCSIDGFASQLADDVVVVAGAVTEQNFVLVPENEDSEPEE
jgi:hypothetical protein